MSSYPRFPNIIPVFVVVVCLWRCMTFVPPRLSSCNSNIMLRSVPPTSGSIRVQKKKLRPRLDDLKCTKSPRAKKLVNFFSAASGEKYDALLPVYAFFALSIHDDATVEMVIINSTSFFQRHEASLTWLFQHSSAQSLCIRDFSPLSIKRTNIQNTWRYLELPTQSANYTFIGDIDILFTSSVLDPIRFEQMKYFGLPYSNIVRNLNATSRRLTGVMLVETERFYTPDFVNAQQSLFPGSKNDEAFLYELVTKAGFGVPSPVSKKTLSLHSEEFLLRYRPTHGVHLSLNRGPGKRMCITSPQPVLDAPLLSEYLLHDVQAYQFISAAAASFETQEMYGMEVVDGVCRSSLQLSNSSI